MVSEAGGEQERASELKREDKACIVSLGGVKEWGEVTTNGVSYNL